MEEVLDNGYSAPNENQFSNEGPSLKTLASEGYNFDFSRILETGWKAMSKDIWWFILYAFVSGIMIYLSFITIIGWIFIIFPLLAGFPIYAQKALNNQTRSFNTFFDGFKFFSPLLGLMGLTILISLILFAPILFVVGDLWLNIFQDGFTDPSTMQDFAIGFQGKSLFLNLYQYFIQVLISAFTLLSIPLVVFGKLDGWEALKWSVKIAIHKIWWFLLLAFLLAVMQVIGVYACCVGVLFAYPLAECIKFAAYYEIVGLSDKREFPEEKREDATGYQR